MALYRGGLITQVFKTGFTVINILISRYFQENKRYVCKWIGECTTKSDELSDQDSTRWQKQEIQSSIIIEMSLSILDHLLLCYLFITNSLNSPLLLVHSANPLTNTLPVLLIIPGSEHVYYLHFHDSM